MCRETDRHRKRQQGAAGSGVGDAEESMQEAAGAWPGLSSGSEDIRAMMHVWRVSYSPLHSPSPPLAADSCTPYPPTTCMLLLLRP